ncbi:MAG: PDZ domain-containing protein, partial [Angustibacter sp.]
MTVPDQALEPAGSHDQFRGLGLSSRLTTALVLGLLSIALLGGLFLIPAPFAIFGPGPATNVLGAVGGKQLITITGAPTYPASGTLDMTTIEVFGGPGSRITLVRALRGWLSGQEAVVPEESVFRPDKTEKEIRSENSAQMASSQEDATAAGLREAGLTVTEKITIDSVRNSAPAARTLRAGDVLLNVRGQKVTSPDSIRAAIRELRPGDQVP